ncbi:MAG: hypothetical protein NC489_44885 [Ruminococcus flavefaciens]|nr:hypothetical protein [Ruminococcus flavefaciens]
MEYKYLHQRDAYEEKDEGVSLHDCRAEKILFKDGMLSFYFPEGISVGKNVGGERKFFDTDGAWVTFPLLAPDFIETTVYIFTKEDGKVFVEEYDEGELLRLVNEKSYSLEFITEYSGYRVFRFECYLWFDEEPYHKECEIIIAAEKMLCRWNEMHEKEE